MQNILKNIPVDWACLREPDRKFKPNWRVDAIVDGVQAKEIYETLKSTLRAMVLDRQDHAKNVQERELLQSLLDDDKNMLRAIFTKTEDGKFRIRAKRDATDGMTPPHLVDENKQPLSEKAYIGRGDTVNLAIVPVPWIMAGKSVGITLSLFGVQLVKKGSRSATAKPIGNINWDGTAAATETKDNGFGF